MKFRVEYVNKLKIAITTIFVVLLSLFAFVFKDFFDVIENKFVDFRSSLSTDSGLYSARFKPADKDIVIISINDITRQEVARSSELGLTHWPWSRVVWARLINFLEKEQPKAVIVDLNFSNYENLSSNYSYPDMHLADVLGYYDNTILSTALRIPHSKVKSLLNAKNIEDFENPYNPTSASLKMKIDNPILDRNITYYSHAPIPNIFTNSTTMGVTNLVTYSDRGENVRYSQPVFKLIKEDKEYYIPSIALATMIKNENLEQFSELIPIENNVLKFSKHSIQLNEKGQALINWHSSDNAYIDIPVSSILLSMVRGDKQFDANGTIYPMDFFKDKIILISQTQLGVETHNTPVAKDMPDAQIKATIIDNYLNDSDVTNLARKKFVKKITPYKGYIITVAFCVAIVFTMLIATNVVLAFFNGAFISLSYLLLAIFLFCHPKFRILIDIAMPMYFIVSVFIVSFILKAHHEFKKKRKIEKTFGNLVSEKVLKQLVNKPHRLSFKSSVQNVTVMSCSITNNLQISDEMSPEKYVELINDVFNSIEKIIFKHNGTINRFVGNTVYAYWGYPIQSRKDAQNAVSAAMEITKVIDSYNLSVQKLKFVKGRRKIKTTSMANEISFKVQIAMNTGDALIGQIGPSRLTDFTVMGEQVDIIERISNVCSEFGKTVVLTQNTLNKLTTDVAVDFIGQVKMKSNNSKIKIYELLLPVDNTLAEPSDNA